MRANQALNRSEKYQVTTPSDCEIRMTRLFNAPRQLVFEAMTRPEHVKRWWGILDDEHSVPVCEIDLRVGGAWRFVNRFPKGECAFYGVYREVEAARAPGVHGDLRAVPRHRVGRHLRLYRREGSDAHDRHGPVSVTRGA